MNFVLRLSWLLLLISTFCDASQIKYLHKLIESQRLRNLDLQQDQVWSDEEDVAKIIHPVYIGPQEGLMKADRIDSLPMQPPVKFNQYAGYVTVDPNAGRALFYYFVESPEDSSTKPLLLWLNGGPGCSSLGYGAMEEIGPFRVNSDGKSLSANEYAWNKVANVLFLESPAGVGYSYSNLTSDYNTTGDKKTWEDSYTFLINWLDRFPQYKTRDLYIAGESYAGHYIPQLASFILAQNYVSNNRSSINLKSIAIGNAYVDSGMNDKATFDYLWTHAMISDATHQSITKTCDFARPIYSDACIRYITKAYTEIGDIDMYNIYAPFCDDSEDDAKPSSASFYLGFDPCTDNYVESYLNREEVQNAFHAIDTTWSLCSDKVGPHNWIDLPRSVVPLFKKLIIANKINIWLYSGDTDANVPVTSSRYTISTMNLRLDASWRAWYSKNGTEVGGYVEGYKGLTLVTIRDAGHDVPSYQQERSLTMISSFLQGKLPPFNM